MAMTQKKGLRVGLFGSFYPYVNRLATTNVGLAELWAGLQGVTSVEVIAPRGSLEAPGSMSAKVRVSPSWRYDSGLSILRATLRISRRRDDFDVFVFNTYLTAYGTSNIANATGLIAPVLLSVLSCRPPLVYMHNLLETQEVEKLGYRPNWAVRKAVRFLELLLFSKARVVVPLERQSRVVSASLGHRPPAIVVPYVEIIRWVKSPRAVRLQVSGVPKRGPRILLFGAWGPQKSLAPCLSELGKLIRRGADFTITVAGSINPNFASYKQGIDRVLDTVPRDRISTYWNPADEDLPSIFEEADVLLLPYNATGGYSAVMNTGAAFGIRMISFDFPEFRELSTTLGCDVAFVPIGDTRAMCELAVSSGSSAGLDAAPTNRLERAQAAARELLLLADIAGQ